MIWESCVELDIIHFFLGILWVTHSKFWDTFSISAIKEILISNYTWSLLVLEEFYSWPLNPFLPSRIVLIICFAFVIFATTHLCFLDLVILRMHSKFLKPVCFKSVTLLKSGIIDWLNNRVFSVFHYVLSFVISDYYKLHCL